ncbi:hypothetical protein ACU4GD_44925 [Cupriavidus basilensis]
MRDKLAPYAPVKSVELVREGDPEHPWAWVNLDVDPFTAAGRPACAELESPALRRQHDALAHSPPTRADGRTPPGAARGPFALR